MTEAVAVPRLPAISMIAAGLFFTGITYASTLNYGAIVGIDTLGIPNTTYAVLLMAASLVGAAASVVLGYISDRVPDRRILVVGCALMGALGFGLIFLFRNQLVFVLAICVIMPFGGALFSQSFSFARAYNNLRNPARAEFLTSVLRTIFAVAWAIVPPFVGWIAAATSVFNVYGIAAAAYLVCAAIYAVLLRNPDAKVGIPKRQKGEAGPVQARARIEPVILVGIAGVTLIFMATYINTVTVPLLVTVTLKGSFGELGIFAGLAAALELPFMILWGYALRWVGKYTIIIGAALLYALYLVLLSRAGSITEILWLQLLNGPATAALMSIPISYLQDAIRGRVGLSTSLLDVAGVTSALASAALFGALTASGPNYPLMFVVAASLAVAGAAILFAAHRVFKAPPAPEAA
ncbi:MAG: MFS transporter [Devosia nanyangense]|uniref:MFS transporter n=1 Tax=Devosia nanyangense TaxID=1228055 RepID=A0A933NXM7_9HYPH|nr:MFS transporter [Devosia nanyangense]